VKLLPSLRSDATLLPEELSDAAQLAIAELTREGESRNTQASYRAALRYWAAWFRLRYGQALTLPVPAAAVLQFIVDHARRSTRAGLRHELPPPIDEALVKAGFKGKCGALALSTLSHRLAVLSKAHRTHELKNPCEDAKVRDLLSKTRRAHAKRGDLARKKDAITIEPLAALLATCDDSLSGKRDRAVLLFAWATGGRRRSEVSEAHMDYLSRVDEHEYSYNLVHSKTNQSGAERQDNHKPIVGEAAQALSDWLSSAQITEGFIFRRLHKADHIGNSLSPAAVREIVVKRCSLAGINGDFSAHSLRSGFISQADRSGISLGDTMALTGHRSAETLLGYTRSTRSTRSAALRALGAERREDKS
jgi:integrase